MPPMVSGMPAYPIPYNALWNWRPHGDCRAQFGNPSLTVNGYATRNPEWEAANLVMVPLPWQGHAAWDPTLPMNALQVHRLAAPSLERVLAAIWLRAGRSQAEIDRVGLSAIGGGFSWRTVTNGRSLSTHAYGCAVDFDPERNKMGNTYPNLGLPQNRYVIDAFRAEGWTWGGTWSNPDGMHFEASN